MKLKKNSVDLTDLAIGIIVLGIIVTIGANILINVRDTNLLSSDLTLESSQIVPTVEDGRALGNTNYFSSVTSVTNQSGGETLTSGNYSVTVDAFGNGHFNLLDAEYNYTNLNVTYNTYDTANNPAYDVADKAAIGIAEYGNWFDIIVIVGVAAVILSLIFMAFGQAKGGQGSMQY